MVEIAPHELGETPRMRHLPLEYVPAVVAGLLGDLLDGSTFLGTPVVSAMVECIVDNNAYDIDLMRRIGASEVIERVVQQRKPDRCEVFRSDRNENVARRVIRSLGEYRFGRSAVYDHKLVVLKTAGDELGQNPRVGPDRFDQEVREVEPRRNEKQVLALHTDNHVVDIQWTRRRPAP